MQYQELLKNLRGQAQLCESRIVNNAAAEASPEAREQLLKVRDTLDEIAKALGYYKGQRAVPIHIATQLKAALNHRFRTVATIAGWLPDLVKFLVGEEFVRLADERVRASAR